MKRMEVEYIGIYDANFVYPNEQINYKIYRESCFFKLEDKKVFLFGVNNASKKFILSYQSDYRIVRILENDSSWWGKELLGISIASPDSIVGEQDAYKVIICISDYKPLFEQLKRMGVENIGIYDAEYIYPEEQINYSSYCQSCFYGLEDKKIFLFGVNDYSKKFILSYQSDYRIVRILENDSFWWGKELLGIPVASPDSIVGEQDAYKVIICDSNYKFIFRQLKRMDVESIGIYDANHIYPEDQISYECYREGCFYGLNDKKVFLFGANCNCEKFILLYGTDYNVERILENDPQTWGSQLLNIPIDSPESIVGEQSAYKVIICSTNSRAILLQLKRMGVENIGIYDANYVYPEHQINYESYRRSCFDELCDKKIFLFGAGQYSERFIALYGNEYKICKILDNDPQKWGKELSGIIIDSPESIVGEQDAYKVIICARDFIPLFWQARKMQIAHIGIYDIDYVYAGKQNVEVTVKYKEFQPKKYHVGYISGVFDLFHIGHLNMFRRAKEQCDYLIAAVTSDEYVRGHKQCEPFIPFEERVEMIRACRYVDEVVGVPYKYAGTVEAFQKYHFDCQFCGSDCANDPWWLEQKAYLENQGAELVFLSYTEQTSSTKIKALIEEKLV
ncbi:glycerol-3-phosphate cytidylyltransferase [Lachnospiraceae bacterium]|nr:glycerol-3-phosphate cytidylyltransferase [Lachnospiraceae bacterium]